MKTKTMLLYAALGVGGYLLLKKTGTLGALGRPKFKWPGWGGGGGWPKPPRPGPSCPPCPAPVWPGVIGQPMLPPPVPNVPYCAQYPMHPLCLNPVTPEQPIPA